ncbi:MAG: alpha-2-macroglobulin [Candidatus Binatia bacterium]
MRRGSRWWLLGWSLVLTAFGARTALAAAGATVERFSPQGTVKPVRQVTAVFSAPMVPFGDLRDVAEPFTIDCPETGTARWVDSRTWAYDFGRDLPAGLRCTFALRDGLRTRAGERLAGPARFEFTTGGPAIRGAVPSDGAGNIDESQVFILALDGQATPASVLADAGFEVEGLAERVGVDILDDAARDATVASLPYWLKPTPPFLAITARQAFPNGATVRLVWGAGISSPSGIATDADQVLEFKTRPRFTAELSCERENAKAGCTPLTPISVRFSAPVPWAQASQIRLAADGSSRIPDAPDTPVELVSAVQFPPPFPESTAFRIALPPDLRDDAGRALADPRPLTGETSPFPPLAKFAARFGLLEANADPALPVTVRNLEPEVRGEEVRATRARPSAWRARLQELYARLSGHAVRIERAEDVLPWLRRLAVARRTRSMFADLPAEAPRRAFTLPQPDGPQLMQVIGIPFEAKGLYLVELASPRLGAALLGKDEPMYVPAGALVTNLAVHFKWARESSLVWVTSLDSAQPVAGAHVAVQNCTGTVLATATTGAQGIARVSGLPKPDDAPSCFDSNSLKDHDALDFRDHWSAPALTSIDSGLLITAQTADDLSFVHSSWSRGIEPWRFNLPYESWEAPLVVHTIFDRPLFRAGDTVHMKHVLRDQTMSGFTVPQRRPPRAVITHLGSGDKYELPLTWDDNGFALQEWPIPATAKLGQYQVALGQYQSGSFRLEQFRVPLMKATVQMPAEPLTGAASVPVDVAVRYLAGGAAADLPVVLRAQIRDRAVRAPIDFERFSFGSGPVTAGVVRESQSEPDEGDGRAPAVHQKRELALDSAGTARAEITELPRVETPRDLVAELEYRDPSGAVQTAAASVPMWPAALLPGIEAEYWVGRKDGLAADVAVIDVRGRPVAGAPVEVDAFRRQYYSHRKRLVGGFYAYEHVQETRALGRFCNGKTDAQGVLRCRAAAPATGEVILVARVRDAAGREAAAHTSAYVADAEPWGFPVEASDRMDVLPEKREYEPGETARFQVRMPFERATALVTVEREGIGAANVVRLEGGMPVVEVPIDGSYSPNTFVSVLAVRGRVGGTQPTAMVDLGKPAFKLGIAEVRVGWRDHRLNVTLEADRPAYRVRETAEVKIAVRRADGAPPPAGSEVAVAAVDEGLLELQPNPSWNLLDAMMGRRGYDVRTAAAEMEVIGKRHYGRKALPQGGGGGRQATRELFETLLLWAGRVPLDADGRVTLKVPLNDSLTAFRIVAVATGGIGEFGTGATAIRSTQDLMLISGLPPLVRQGDRFPAQFTLRNTTDRALEVSVRGQVDSGIDGAPAGTELAAQTIALQPGEARVIEWPITAPAEGDALRYTIEATGADGVSDRLAIAQQLREAVPARTLQATLLRADKPLAMPVERPADALPERGGIGIAVSASLGGTTSGIEDYLRRYPYTCLEQQVSIAVGLNDADRWNAIAAALPSYLDADGLLKYFPSPDEGSDVLTAYVVSVTSAAGWEIPAVTRERLLDGLRGFVAGRVARDSGPMRAPDLALRKLAALEALARADQIDPASLDTIAIEPNLWPTSAVLDWWGILQRTPSLPDRDARLGAVEQILRARLALQGTVLGFSTERSDELWWLMVSTDLNAVRLLLHLLEFKLWPDDLARVLRGALGRQSRGHWRTTPANAYGAVAMRRFAHTYEAAPVTGQTRVALGPDERQLDWTPGPPPPVGLPWPPAEERLSIEHRGTGAPWVAVTSRAAIPLTAPLSSGYRISKTVTPLEPRVPGRLSRGDRLRVRLEVEAQTDMTWVVFDDPIPAGASHLGTGLASDSQIDSGGSANTSAPDFVERRFDAYRAYFEFLPKGRTAVEYVVRLNQNGSFAQPPTRVEALYAPEMFGEIPNAPVEVLP